MSRRPSPPSTKDGITRRRLLIGGGAGVGLVLAWAAWPRRYQPNLVAAPGEALFGAFLKIGADGHVTVVSPQVEMGQGVYTTLPQLVADELGADWRTIGVEPAPINPLYGNRLLGREIAADVLPSAERVADEWAVRSTLMVTAGSTAARGWELPMREAGATARALLCMAAAARWGITWEQCEAANGFVTSGDKRLRFGELAAEAAAMTPPALPPLRTTTEGRLTGQSLPRLDLPAKVDGSALYAGDVRLPDMQFASVRAAPVGGVLSGFDRSAADAVRGVTAVVETPGWVGVVGTNWWAANRGLEAGNPRFRTEGRLIDDGVIERALAGALGEPGERMEGRGDVDAAFEGQQLFAASYSVAPALHAAIEPMCATAHWANDRLELWLPTQAPAAARRDAAAAIGVAEGAVTIYPTMIGGSFGRKLESDAAVQAAVLARNLRRPVQLTWSRVEDLAQDRVRAPAQGRMEARLVTGGRIEGWRARIAAPASGHEIARRLIGGAARSLIGDGSGGDRAAVAGALPPYAIPHVAIDHHPADIGVPVGDWRGGAASYGTFFAECFIDELAAAAGVDPFSYRVAMLGGAPRLARCLTTVTASGGWQGGGAGSAQGIACFSGWGSHIAVLADARLEGNRPVVQRLVAVADVGQAINPDVVRQQIEGGLLWGAASVVGMAGGFQQGLGSVRSLGATGLPTLANSPEVTVDLIRSDEPPGGASELGVPAAAPAIANALFAATGRRFRRLPMVAQA
ncbi:isoquinoline 1-oxidoreductase beta subunit [Sphingomonas jejuensis]|uniref:Isoquinoline 1-oxidoreductase beta subunit n=1 Tax=Sphingomonas jejuensis TaxID=904715 RepID=A0ABX0XKN8_9SPHN|nr:molybdopterin cofactor-binding domain-containing protein [Sphingomonas jejuensis]NJC33913.1 isoquinoline 1-oxidoreductase beta subunit [Sphingomonas jejuensis]